MNTLLTGINESLQQLQNETPNCGGCYHFTQIDLPSCSDILESVREFMLRFKEYQNPYYLDESKGARTYIRSRDPKSLILEPVNGFKDVLDEKLRYWSNHRTSLDCRETITSLYLPLEDEFKRRITSYLNDEVILNIYSVKGIDTFYCFGNDHVNDDTLIQTKRGYYILHFGWSS